MKIKEIASKIRKDFEEGKISEMEIEKLYLQYNPEVGNIRRFVTRAKKIFPSLNCGIATLILLKRLQKGRLVKGFYKGNSHTFLFLENDTIVDITADQYNGPKVYVGPLQSPWKL